MTQLPLGFGFQGGPMTRPLLNMRSPKSGDMLAATTTTAEQTFDSSQVTIPANSLQVGQALHVRATGTFTVSTAGPTQRPRIRLGSALMVDAGAQMLLANTPDARYLVDAILVVRAVGTSGMIEASGRLEFTTATSGQATAFLAGPSGVGTESGNPVTIDTTIPNVLRLTTQWSAATAGNTNTLRTMIVNRLLAVNP